MAKLIPNVFSQYHLTPDEYASGTMLSDLQIKCIQNTIAATAEYKMNLIFDPNDPKDFGMQTAFSAGAIQALQALIQTSEETTKAQLELAASQSPQ
jgi:hypothetical protein